jgi:hypothetical protein
MLALAADLLHAWLQARYRCYRAHKYHKKLKCAAIVAQCRWRGRIARKELKKLKMVCIIFRVM